MAKRDQSLLQRVRLTSGGGPGGQGAHREAKEQDPKAAKSVHTADYNHSAAVWKQSPVMNTEQLDGRSATGLITRVAGVLRRRS